MLVKVEARNGQGSLLTLPMEDVSSGLVVEDIQGLDPVKATIVSSSFAGQDGTQYHTSRRESRNIVFRLELQPDYFETTVRDLRTQLYKYFMPKSPSSLRFFTDDDLVVDISGRVESFETPLFTKEPSVDISIICFDPDFVELAPVELEGMTTSDTTETLIEYGGSVETGIQFVLEVDRTLTEFTVYHRLPDGTIRAMEFAYPLIAGDAFSVSSVSGDKEVVLTRSGTESPVLYSKSPQSGWIELENGDNYIRVYADGAGIPFSISYIPRHGGL